MAKSGFWLRGARGKFAGSVLQKAAGGATVVRENVSPSNPKTALQTTQRAKFKLMSQIASALSNVIAIPREGAQSPRNQFVSLNFPFVFVNQGVAQLSYENLQLTKSNTGFAGLVASRSAATGIAISLDTDMSASLSRVVYIAFSKSAEANLVFEDSIVVEAPGANGTFPGTIKYIEGDVVLYGYGMTDLSSAATQKYGNLNVSTGRDVATLIINSSLSSADYKFTKTRGTTIFAGQTQNVSAGPGQALVFLTPSGNGTVSGAGAYALGSTVNVTATPAAGASFVGWMANGSDTIVSTAASYSFTLDGLTDLIALFQDNPVNESYRVDLSPNLVAGGTIAATVATGDSVIDGTQGAKIATVTAGNSITITATPAENYRFVGWLNGRQFVTTNAAYTFTPNADISLVAEFAASALPQAKRGVTLSSLIDIFEDANCSTPITPFQPYSEVYVRFNYDINRLVSMQVSNIAGSGYRDTWWLEAKVADDGKIKVAVTSEYLDVATGLLTEFESGEQDGFITAGRVLKLKSRDDDYNDVASMAAASSVGNEETVEYILASYSGVKDTVRAIHAGEDSEAWFIGLNTASANFDEIYLPIKYNGNYVKGVYNSNDDPVMAFLPSPSPAAAQIAQLQLVNVGDDPLPENLEHYAYAEITNITAEGSTYVFEATTSDTHDTLAFTITVYDENEEEWVPFAAAMTSPIKIAR